jgi:hypothetical protein
MDPSHAHHLPLALLERVFESRPPHKYWLGYEEFKAECLLNVTVRSINRFFENAIILLLVDTANVEQCREWFINNATALKNFEESKNTDLANLTRLIWKDGMLNEALRQDCTLDAASRLKAQVAKALCVALDEEHSGDVWAEKELKCHREAPISTAGVGLKPFRDLHLDLWYKPGNVAECRLCGFRLPQKSLIPMIAQSIYLQLVPCPRVCRLCKNRVLALMPLKRPVAKPSNSNVSSQIQSQSKPATDDDAGVSFSGPVEPLEAV